MRAHIWSQLASDQRRQASAAARATMPQSRSTLGGVTDARATTVALQRRQQLADASPQATQLHAYAQITASNPVQRRLARPPAAGLGTSVAQRLIVNTGEDAFIDEVQKPRGWIIAKDIDIALLDGGDGQQIAELDELGQIGQIGATEKIYLQGHGSAGELGNEDPATLAGLLRPVLPDNYTGTIYSLSCSAGVPGNGVRSGIETLARTLNIPNIRLEGAAGVALNHPSLPGAHRVVDEGRYDNEADPIVDQLITQHQVDQLWQTYVTSVWPGSLTEAASTATALSKAFYIELTERLDQIDGLLLPTDADTTVVTTRPG